MENIDAQDNDNFYENSDDFSYSDEEYEFAYDGIVAQHTQTDFDQNNISAFIRPDLVDEQGNLQNVQTRLNEEWVLINGDITSYNTRPFEHPERTRIISIGELSAWALECDEADFQDGRDGPATKEELELLNQYKLDALWERLRAMTLRIQVDDFVATVMRLFRLDPGNAQTYKEMMKEAAERRNAMPEKTEDEAARHPRAVQHAESLLGIPVQRKEHPRLGSTRLVPVTRAAYDEAARSAQNLLEKIEQEYDRVCKSVAVLKQEYQRVVDNGKKKGWKRVYDRFVKQVERRKTLELFIPRLKNNPKARLPLAGEPFPDAYNVSKENGVVFEYMDAAVIEHKRSKHGKNTRALPMLDPVEPDDSDYCSRQILVARMKDKYPQWNVASKHPALASILANGVMVQGQWMPTDVPHNPSQFADRILVAEQFLDDAWPNQWGQSVWTTRIQVRLVSDMKRKTYNPAKLQPVYYVRDLTHSLGRLRSVDLASPHKGRERLLVIRFERQLVVIQPTDLKAAHEALAKDEEKSAARSVTSDGTSGTDDLDALVASIDGTNGKGKRSKKKKKKRRQKEVTQQVPPGPAGSSLESPAQPLAPKEQEVEQQPSFDTMEDLMTPKDDVRDTDIMQDLNDVEQVDKVLAQMEKQENKPLRRDEMTWAQGVAMRFDWLPDGEYVKTDRPILTAACADNVMERCFSVYVGTYDGCVYRILWRAGQTIQCEMTPQPTPILDLHMYTPHLVARTIDDVIMFHGTHAIRPYRLNTGKTVGASVCGALMLTLTHTGNAWLNNVHMTGIHRNIVPSPDLWVKKEVDAIADEALLKDIEETRDAYEQTVTQTAKKADEEEEETTRPPEAVESQEESPQEEVDTPPAFNAHAVLSQEEPQPPQAVETTEAPEITAEAAEEEFKVDAGGFQEEAFEDTGIETEVGRTDLPDDGEKTGEPETTETKDLAHPITYLYRGTHMVRKELRILYPSGVIRRLPIAARQERALEFAQKRQRNREYEMETVVEESDVEEEEEQEKEKEEEEEKTE